MDYVVLRNMKVISLVESFMGFLLIFCFKWILKIIKVCNLVKCVEILGYIYCLLLICILIYELYESWNFLWVFKEFLFLF